MVLLLRSNMANIVFTSFERDCSNADDNIQEKTTWNLCVVDCNQPFHMLQKLLRCCVSCWLHSKARCWRGTSLPLLMCYKLPSCELAKSVYQTDTLSETEARVRSHTEAGGIFISRLWNIICRFCNYLFLPISVFNSQHLAL